MASETKRASKFLSYVLRHRPDEIGIHLDPQGWVDVVRLLERLEASGQALSQDTLFEIVRESDKQRFELSDDRSRIRARQGHSIPVDLGYRQRTPPEILYHGTVEKFLPSIRRLGLQKRERHHVHLSAEAQTAREVGARRGPPVVLIVAAGAMHAAGHRFYLSDNGVWLTDAVPSTYLTEPSV